MVTVMTTMSMVTIMYKIRCCDDDDDEEEEEEEQQKRG